MVVPHEKQLCLSQRLQALADIVPPGSRIADIGTDHGYLPIWLLQQGRIAAALACDVNAGPLEHARRSATHYGLEQKISFRLGDGLSCVQSNEIDTVILAGMGGETIASILERASWVNAPAYLLLLQPMTKAEYLRSWLASHGYRIFEEHLVFENHTYFPIMAARGGHPPQELTPGECWGGVALQHDPLQGKALDAMLRQLSRAIEGLERSHLPENACKAADQRRLQSQLQKMKEEWQHANGTGN